MKAIGLPDLLAPYNYSRVAEHVEVSKETVSNWANGKTSPSSERLPALAEILRIDLGDLARIVAEDSKKRTAASVSHQQVGA